MCSTVDFHEAPEYHIMKFVSLQNVAARLQGMRDGNRDSTQGHDCMAKYVIQELKISMHVRLQRQHKTPVP